MHVRSYRLEIGRREGLLRLVDAVFVAVVAETILERFVHVAAQDGHTGHIDVLNLQRTLGRRSLRLRTFAVIGSEMQTGVVLLLHRNWSAKSIGDYIKTVRAD